MLERNPNKATQARHWKNYRKMLMREYKVTIDSDTWAVIRAVWNHGYWTCYDAHYLEYATVDAFSRSNNGR